MNLGFSKVGKQEVSIKIIRADGSEEDLGVVAYYSSNPLKRAIFKIKKFLGIKVPSSIIIKE